MIHMDQGAYENLLSHVLRNGDEKGDRTGTGTLSVFGTHLRYNLAEGFPLLTTKKVHFKAVAAELLWFLAGDMNNNILTEQGVNIWNEWAGPDGELGPIYGEQWRSWPDGKGHYIDQIKEVIEGIKTNPNGRRHIVSAWNVAEIDRMALPPCHILFQFYVSKGKLSCQLYQRSADMFLGVPFNIASYALLTHMVAAQTGLEVGDFIWTGGDTHIYSNHIEQVETQLRRDPYWYKFPRIELKPRDSIFDYTPDDIILHDYKSYPGIKAPVAI